VLVGSGVLVGVGVSVFVAVGMGEAVAVGSDSSAESVLVVPAGCPSTGAETNACSALRLQEISSNPRIKNVITLFKKLCSHRYFILLVIQS
jgi:hypothetical protein